MRSIQSLKVMGTISLGLLTGTLMSQPLITVPALLALPNAAPASRAHDITITRLARLTTALSTLALAAYSTTLLFATERHPYLIYSAALSGLAGVWVWNQQVWAQRRVVEDGFEYLEGENAEVVQSKILRLRDWVGVGISSLGFVFAVIGGYGEGFTD